MFPCFSSVLAVVIIVLLVVVIVLQAVDPTIFGKVGSGVGKVYDNAKSKLTFADDLSDHHFMRPYDTLGHSNIDVSSVADLNKMDMRFVEKGLKPEDLVAENGDFSALADYTYKNNKSLLFADPKNVATLTPTEDMLFASAHESF